MLLPGTNSSLLLVQRTVTRTIVLQETISKVFDTTIDSIVFLTHLFSEVSIGVPESLWILNILTEMEDEDTAHKAFLLPSYQLYIYEMDH
ncbi:hypothetical protein STEG23_019645 [Scotinomys teguina]